MEVYPDFGRVVGIRLVAKTFGVRQEQTDDLGRAKLWESGEVNFATDAGMHL